MDARVLEQLLKRGAQHRASDAVFKVGQPPGFRIGGQLHYLQGERLRAEHTEALTGLVLQQAGRSERISELKDLDLPYEVVGLGRYRVNIFRQRGTLALVMRAIPLTVPTFEEIGCSPVAQYLCEQERGLVLVVGAAGNGKSTTLAAMVGHLNRTRRLHVVTIEDPIEFLHEDQLSTISQREVGTDTASFANALRAALRQAPDVIMLGEIRDEETMSVALKAAETGHLVLSSLHTANVAKTLGRILSLSAGEGQSGDTRMRLAEALQGIVAQRLIDGVQEGQRVLAQEVLVMTGTARDSVRGTERALSLDEVMERGSHPYGMQTFKMHLRDLVARGLIPAHHAGDDIILGNQPG